MSITITPRPGSGPRVADGLALIDQNIREQGATPAEAHVMREITRIIMSSGDPAAAARQVLNVIQRDRAATPPAALPTADSIVASILGRPALAEMCGQVQPGERRFCISDRGHTDEHRSGIWFSWPQLAVAEAAR